MRWPDAGEQQERIEQRGQNAVSSAAWLGEASWGLSPLQLVPDVRSRPGIAAQVVY